MYVYAMLCKHLGFLNFNNLQQLQLLFKRRLVNLNLNMRPCVFEIKP